jgi:flagellar protein FliS
METKLTNRKESIRQVKQGITMNAAMLYQQTAVTTQNQGRLIVLLYDGAIRFLRQARVGMQNGDYAKKSVFLARAQDVVFELNASLNMELGGEISNRLRSVYTFIWTRLSQVNMKNDIAVLDRLIAILEDLAGAWRQISA